MSCAISAYGKRFDVERALRATGLKPDEIWLRGYPNDEGRKPVTSGFTIQICDDFPMLEKQVKLSMKFLGSTRVRQRLKRMSRTRGVDYFVLEFGIAWLDVASQNDLLPARLISFVAESGLSVVVAHYPVSPTR
jgi:hypothetical protein